MSEDPRRARRPARYREDAPLPQHYLDLTTGEWVAAIVDWTPEGEMFRTEGARFRDYLAAWEASARWRGRDEPPRQCHEIAERVRAETMSTLVRRFLEAVRDGGWSPETMEAFFSPSYRRYLTATSVPLTAEGQRQRASKLRTAFPDAHITLEDMLAEGDRVAYRLTIRGTHQGEFQGIAPTGKQVTVSFTAIVHIEDGRLVEEWGGLDLLDLLRQLGRDWTG